jgi:hypothetical protein
MTYRSDDRRQDEIGRGRAVTMPDTLGATRAIARHHLANAVRRADYACERHDVASLTAAVRDVLRHASDEWAMDLVAVIELAAYDLELAEIRWTHLRGRLS